MRISCLIPSLGALLLAAPLALAQGPGGPGGGPPGGFGGPGGGRSLSKADDTAELVSKVMAFDTNKDGSLSKAELTDTRLFGLFDRADANKDGIITKAELTAPGRERIRRRRPRPGGGGPGGPGGFGGPGGGGPGGPGGRPGEVLSSMVQQRLNLTDEQKTQMAALQKEVDAKLETILDSEQKASSSR